MSLCFLTVGDAHIHHCLDGQEVAVSVHYESLNGHATYTANQNDEKQVHNDYEFEVETKLLQGKLKDLHETSELNTHILLDSFRSVSVDLKFQHYFSTKETGFFAKRKLSAVIPPLRAPPSNA